MPGNDSAEVKDLVVRMAESAIRRRFGRPEKVTFELAGIDRSQKLKVDFTFTYGDGQQATGWATVQYDEEHGFWTPGNVHLEDCSYMCAYSTD